MFSKMWASTLRSSGDLTACSSIQGTEVPERRICSL